MPPAPSARRRVSLVVVIATLSVAPLTTVAAQCADGSPMRGGVCRVRARVDTNAFLVLPFAVSGPASVQYLKSSMVDLFHMALNDVAGMRIEYAPDLPQQIASSDPRTLRTAFGSAVELGIGRVISGTIVALGPDIRIRAQVFDAERNRQQFEVSGRANLENVSVVVDSLAAQILARRAVPAAERTRLSLGEYSTRSPKALQAYLVARQHSRRRERAVAADSLKSALRHDPDFGLAHLMLHRLESAEGGVTGIPRDTIMLLARARRDRFPERVRMMFDDAREADRLRASAWARALVTRYPNDPDAAFYLADNLFHRGIPLGEPMEAVFDAFRRAIAMDGQDDPELVEHYAGLLSEVGDSAALKALGERECQKAAKRSCPANRAFRLIFRREDPWAIAAEDTTFWGGPANWVLRSAAFDPALGLALTDSLAKLQTAMGRQQGLRGTAYVVRSNVALARGQHQLAWTWLDSAATTGEPRIGFMMLHHIVTGTHEREAAALGQAVRSGTRLAVIRAWWAAATQIPDSAEKYIPLTDDPRDPMASRAVANGLRGLVALRAGDTARALTLFERMRPDNSRPTVPFRLLYPGTPLALLHAKIEAERGNHARARLLLADVYPINEYVPLIGDAEELRARVELALGDTVSARKHLKNVITVWEKADPRLQPRVTAAKGTLATLKASP
jgi:hypothetical protein